MISFHRLNFGLSLRPLPVCFIVAAKIVFKKSGMQMDVNFSSATGIIIDFQLQKINQELLNLDQR